MPIHVRLASTVICESILNLFICARRCVCVYLCVWSYFFPLCHLFHVEPATRLSPRGDICPTRKQRFIANGILGFPFFIFDVHNEAEDREMKKTPTIKKTQLFLARFCMSASKPRYIKFFRSCHSCNDTRCHIKTFILVGHGNLVNIAAVPVLSYTHCSAHLFKRK